MKSYGNHQMDKFCEDADGNTVVRVIAGNCGTWVMSDDVNNASIALTLPAAEGKRHYVSSIMPSYSGATSGKKLVIKDGGVVIATFYIDNAPFPGNLAIPIRLSEASELSIEMDSSGTLGTKGALTVVGYTK
jgi:hypothetical protein